MGGGGRRKGSGLLLFLKGRRTVCLLSSFFRRPPYRKEVGEEGGGEDPARPRLSPRRRRSPARLVERPLVLREGVAVVVVSGGGLWHRCPGCRSNGNQAGGPDADRFGARIGGGDVCVCVHVCVCVCVEGGGAGPAPRACWAAVLMASVSSVCRAAFRRAAASVHSSTCPPARLRAHVCAPAHGFERARTIKLESRGKVARESRAGESRAGSRPTRGVV